MNRFADYWNCWRKGIVILMASFLVLFLALLPFQLVSIFYDGPRSETKDNIVAVIAALALIIGAPILAYKILFEWLEWTTQHLLKKVGYVKKNDDQTG
ncbi:hypothetical protein IEN85_15120 [Pelagicoccus sp. NFK12]|uniref:Uncharacterized protein n=1 Tax=Pelagicoccus enzymogenes TaxID=2773457 RepID=A0A927FBT5_9BACT|nr:hypothetical protein [Pelagicoccus enzymogenes]MBD5780830.1 hypothetical protein [Pelagicoccus enzymogenes]